MTHDPVSFLKAVDNPALSYADRARAVLWFVGQDGNSGMSTTEICRVIEAIGHPKQNVSRLDAQLSTDKKRVNRVPGSKALRLHPRGRTALDDIYLSRLTGPRPPTPTDSVLPRQLFGGTRGYLEKVVFQVNACYDHALFDGCSVMCRRLVETLLIEVYEAAGRPNAIKGTDGHYFMLADLLRVFDGDHEFHVSRNGQQGLKDLKRLGDLAAHNRRFNARREDIDRVRDGLRVATEELLHLAKLA